MSECKLCNGSLQVANPPQHDGSTGYFTPCPDCVSQKGQDIAQSDNAARSMSPEQVALLRKIRTFNKHNSALFDELNSAFPESDEHYGSKLKKSSPQPGEIDREIVHACISTFKRWAKRSALTGKKAKLRLTDRETGFYHGQEEAWAEAVWLLEKALLEWEE